MTREIYRSAIGAERVARASAWLREHGAATELVIVGATREAANDLARTAGLALGATFGWHRVTLGLLAGTLAAPALAQMGCVPVGALPIEALAARMFHELATRGDLGRFEPIRDRPGLPRALARTLDELRLAGDLDALDDVELNRMLAAYQAELVRAGLADRAQVLALAAKRVLSGGADPSCDLIGKPLLLLDVPVRNGRERALLAALAARSPSVLATVPAGDDRTLEHLKTALPAPASEAPLSETPEASRSSALHRLQSGLFSKSTARGTMGDDVVILSAPGESRECVEVARRVRAEAEQGVPFDRMAILLRSPAQYRTHLEEALRRAGVPAYFARGTIMPDPSGRALLALLACAADGLSARRFAEYVSLGEVPDASEVGAPPRAAPASERFVPPDDDVVSDAIVRASQRELAGDAQAPVDPYSNAVTSGTLRAPRLWERLLVDAAVIGGLARWERRLDGLAYELALDRKEIDDPESPMIAHIDRNLEALATLRRFALPLLADLAALPKEATWGTWIDHLAALVTRAIRRPEHVLAVLAELAPMANVGPVQLREVRIVLEGRLTDLVVLPQGRSAGRVYVASADDARGRAFDVVFVPGLAEKIFPQKVSEDPILTDRARLAIPGAHLRTNVDRSADERLALRIAIGAAQKRVVLSYPRVDIEQSRPRTPSFYALEVLRAAEGALPGFDELARRAEQIGAARIGWPAPAHSKDAIDDAEHDLALLETVLRRPERETVGTMRYLLSANAHLARALRFRARRWNARLWNSADGLVDPAKEALPALAAHQLAARSYSPTALQNFAACPYKFVLQALHRLAPRQEPSPLEELNALQRGSLIHETQFALFNILRERKLLPVTAANLAEARACLDEALCTVGGTYYENLAPAIDRVWQDGIDNIKADMREWLRRTTIDTEWVPTHFELSFGLADRRDRDPRSVDEAVLLDCGIKLRGSIDLVEKNASGIYRATDHKTGKARTKQGTVIAGGETLQPVLYALVLEKIFGDGKVGSGRLYFCTSTGSFEAPDMPLDDEARDAARAVASAVGGALSQGFLPAAPGKGGCEYCDYKAVCGPYEEQRTSKNKKQDRLIPLKELRTRQ